jgi:hypothetical protein
LEEARSSCFFVGAGGRNWGGISRRSAAFTGVGVNSGVKQVFRLAR